MSQISIKLAVIS